MLQDLGKTSLPPQNFLGWYAYVYFVMNPKSFWPQSINLKVLCIEIINFTPQKKQKYD